VTLLTSSDDIFARDARRYEVVKVPELGADAEVRVRSLTGAEWEEYENSLSQQIRRRDGNLEFRVNRRNRRAKLVAMSVVDEQGQLVFDPKRDVVRLSGMNAGALDRIYEVAERLSGKDEQAIEEAEEDFDDAPSGPSTSDSPSLSASPSTNSWPVPQPTP
jgi:hypothetical protein